MVNERIDSLEHLVEDLRKKHPRLVLLVGDNHDSAESSKLFARISHGADVGFFEQVGNPNHSLGTIATKEKLHAKAEELRRASTDPLTQAFIEAQCAPRYAVYVDSGEGSEEYWQARIAYRKVEDTCLPCDHPERKKAVEAYEQSKTNRLATANPFIAHTIANHLETYYSNGKPFLAALQIGSAHLGDLSEYGVTDVKADIKKTLQQQGYTVVTLDICPVPAKGRQRQGQYSITPDFDMHGIDYTIEVIDNMRRDAQRHH